MATTATTSWLTNRPSVISDLDALPLAELLAGDLIVMIGTQAADVVVRVLTAKREGLDMVRYGRGSNDVSLGAHAAQGFVGKPPTAQLNAAPASYSLAHQSAGPIRTDANSASRQTSEGIAIVHEIRSD